MKFFCTQPAATKAKKQRGKRAKCACFPPSSVSFSCLLGFSDFLHDFAKNFHEGWGLERGGGVGRGLLAGRGGGGLARKAFWLDGNTLQVGDNPSVSSTSVEANDKLQSAVNRKFYSIVGYEFVGISIFSQFEARKRNETWNLKGS